MTLSAWQFRLLIRILCWSLGSVFVMVAFFSHLNSGSSETDLLVGVPCQGFIVENEIQHYQKLVSDGKSRRSWDMQKSRLKLRYQFNGREYSGERSMQLRVTLNKGYPVELIVDPHRPSRWDFKPGQGKGLEGPPQVDYIRDAIPFFFLFLAAAAFVAGFVAPGRIAPETKRGRLDNLD